MIGIRASDQSPSIPELEGHQAVMAWAACAAASLSVYALIDMAAVSHGQTVASLLHEVRAAGAVSVLGDARQQAELVTPWLVPLGAHQSLNTNLLSRTVSMALQAPCVTWLSSPLPATRLAAMLRGRTNAMLPESQAVLLRCFDPRVLPELHKVMRPEQASSYWAVGGGEWAYLNRAQQLQSLALSPAGDVDAYEAPLHIDQNQFIALLDAAEVDSVMPELAREEPDAFQALPPGQRAAFTQRCLVLADAWRVDTFAQRVIVGVLALSFGEDFYQQPAWAPWIAQLKEGKISLLQAIEKATTQ